MNCHLFDVDTVSTEAGITELAIVTRLDETSALVAALHLFTLDQIKLDQTEQYKRSDLKGSDPPLPRSYLRVPASVKSQERGHHVLVDFHTEERGGGGGVAVEPRFQSRLGPDSPTFI